MLLWEAGLEEKKEFPEHLYYHACVPKAIFCLHSTTMFMGNFKLCKNASITCQMFTSSGGEKCISVSRPEQELVTRLSASIVSLLFLMLKDYSSSTFYLLRPVLLTPVLSRVMLDIQIHTAEWWVPLLLLSSKGCSPSSAFVLVWYHCAGEEIALLTAWIWRLCCLGSRKRTFLGIRFSILLRWWTMSVARKCN